MPRSRRPPGARKRCNVYISPMLLLIGAGGKADAMARVQLVQVAGFHEEVEGALTAPGLNARHAFHLGGGLQVFEGLRFVHEHLIDAELIEDQAVVFFFLGEQLFQPLFAPLLLFLDRFDDIAVRLTGIRPRAVAEQLVICLDLFPQKLLRSSRDMPMRSKGLCVTMTVS